MAITAEILSRSPLAVPGRKALAGRMVLHQTSTRSEEMYYYMSFNWEELVDLLEDPAEFFWELMKLRGQTPTPQNTLAVPVTAFIKPAGRSLLSLPGRVKDEAPVALPSADKVLGDNAVAAVTRFFLNSLPMEDDNFVNELDGRLADVDPTKRVATMQRNLALPEGGWFLAEFANRTHVLTIHYCRPSLPSPQRYKDGYTEATICQVGDGSFAHVHFDLNLDHVAGFERKVAMYVVDYLEDHGLQQCKEMDKATHFEVGTIEAVFSKVVPPLLPIRKPRDRKFVTEASMKNQAVSLVVEGLSVTKDGLHKLTRVPTFVCSVNEAGLPDGSIVMMDGILKRYIAP